jgi:hypothetical protein
MTVLANIVVVVDFPHHFGPSMATQPLVFILSVMEISINLFKYISSLFISLILSDNFYIINIKSLLWRLYNVGIGGFSMHVLTFEQCMFWRI